MPHNDTLKDVVVVMQHAKIYSRQTVKQYVSHCDPADITDTLKKLHTSYNPMLVFSFKKKIDSTYQYGNI